MRESGECRLHIYECESTSRHTNDIDQTPSCDTTGHTHEWVTWGSLVNVLWVMTHDMSCLTCQIYQPTLRAQTLAHVTSWESCHDSSHACDECVMSYATHCNTLQHTATYCNTLQHTATYCNTLQHTATHLITWVWWMCCAACLNGTSRDVWMCHDLRHEPWMVRDECVVSQCDECVMSWHMHLIECEMSHIHLILITHSSMSQVSMELNGTHRWMCYAYEMNV